MLILKSKFELLKKIESKYKESFLIFLKYKKEGNEHNKFSNLPKHIKKSKHLFPDFSKYMIKSKHFKKLF